MKRQEGFSLIEVVIAILVITTGLLALSGALVLGVTLPERARQQEVAKQLANRVMESIIAAKESPRPGFNTFAAFSPTSGGGLFNAATAIASAPVLPFRLPGPDGVYGTTDDSAMPLQLDIDPGPDGLYSTTADNARNPLLVYTYQIEIMDLNGPPATSKQITVQVNYGRSGNNRRTISLVCILTNFRTL